MKELRNLASTSHQVSPPHLNPHLNSPDLDFTGRYEEEGEEESLGFILSIYLSPEKYAGITQTHTLISQVMRSQVEVAGQINLLWEP